MLQSSVHSAHGQTRDSPPGAALSRRFIREQQRDLDRMQRIQHPRAAYLALVLALWREAGA